MLCYIWLSWVYFRNTCTTEINRTSYRGNDITVCDICFKAKDLTVICHYSTVHKKKMEKSHRENKYTCCTVKANIDKLVKGLTKCL